MGAISSSSRESSCRNRWSQSSRSTSVRPCVHSGLVCAPHKEHVGRGILAVEQNTHARTHAHTHMRIHSTIIHSVSPVADTLPGPSPAEEYVTCHTCRSPDTMLQREIRLTFLQCDNCGSKCSVQSIKSGFQAVTSSRAQLRVKQT